VKEGSASGLNSPYPTYRLLGIEFALDLMYWPTKHLGLWLQPSYGIVARGPGGSHELSSTAGIIVGW
jgi:hypothetical protein